MTCWVAQADEVRGPAADRGAITMILTVLGAVTLVVALAVVELSVAVVDGARARTAADAAALAGVIGGEELAHRVSTRNGAELISIVIQPHVSTDGMRAMAIDPTEVFVAVRVGHMVREARATDAP